jgi:alanyl-tRNA synthetase
VRRIGEIGPVSVVGEGAVGAGLRRNEALTGRAARRNANHFIQLAKTSAAELKMSPDGLAERIAALLDERKRFKREVSEARRKLANERWLERAQR